MYRKAAIFVLILGSSFPTFAAVRPIAPKGWIYQELLDGSGIQKLLGGATGVLSTTIGEDRDATIAIRIYKVKTAPESLKSEADWRKVVFEDRDLSKSHIVLQRLSSSGERPPRYYVEFQTDTGTETMLKSAILGVVVNGEVTLFLYEQHPNTYGKEIAAVRGLYRSLEFSTEK